MADDIEQSGQDAGFTGKNIVLFSDGTGNSSSKLLKTNVWRLYEALDLGDPARDGNRQQIAFYDDGVGNSRFRPLAMLGGVFGFGLKRNVIEIYKFLCRNYREGDRIYGFGYSRGSYTMRLVVALITSMGIAKYTTEAELDLLAKDRWREFRRGFHTNNPFPDFFLSGGRGLRTLFLSAKRKLLGQHAYGKGVPGYETSRYWFADWWNHWFTEKRWSRKAQPYTTEMWNRQVEAADKSGMPHVEFIGVFDTVAAYGGPIVEITRAIDDWFWPVSMPDYRLSTRVRTARHALAIDDKRGSFQPLLWDEVFETVAPDFAERAKADDPRLKQVWFAGMHSDVGGGYSNESLSFVPLLWMLEEAEKAGLHFIDPLRRRINDYANPHGLMHDSRRGPGAFYRYQPRYISAWLHFKNGNNGEDPVSPLTGTFRDLVADGGRYGSQGLLVPPIRLHKDAERRLQNISDGYAPINLPRYYRVDDGIRGTSEAAAKQIGRSTHTRALGTRIRVRRMWYFLAAITIALLLSIPILAGTEQWGLGEKIAGWQAALPAGMQWDQKTLAELLAWVLPAFATNYVVDLALLPAMWIPLLLVFGFAVAMGSSLEAQMGDLARTYWRFRFNPGDGKEPDLPPVNPLSRVVNAMAYRMRMSRGWQTFFTYLKWYIMPGVFALLLWASLFSVVAYAFPQLFERAENEAEAVPLPKPQETQAASG